MSVIPLPIMLNSETGRENENAPDLMVEILLLYSIEMTLKALNDGILRGT